MSRKGIALFFIFLSLGGVWLAERASLAEQGGLTEEEKTQKRLQFNRFVEEELSRQEAERKEQASKEKLWAVTFSPNYGYDSNVNLDASHRGDGFFQGILEGSLKLKHEGLGSLIGPGRFGVGGNAELTLYESDENLEYQNFVLSSFFDTKITSSTVFKVQYEQTFLDYFKDNDLDYVSYKLKPILTKSLNSRWAEGVYTVFGWKDFTDRKVLAADGGRVSDERRFDHFYEAGCISRFAISESAITGLTLGYKRNDSNDIQNDFNDYHSLKANAHVFYQAFQQISLMGYGGYEFKQYDARKFSGNSIKDQRDHFFYLGASITYDIQTSWQMVVSYLYKENHSNDAVQEYSGTVLTAGMNFLL